MLKKKAVSPVVATVLLVVMVIVIGLIIFLWFRSFVPESGEKFGRNMNLVCDEVVFQSGFDASSGIITIVNTGNVPIYNLNLKITKDKSHETKSLLEIDSTWPDLGLRQGETFNSGNLNSQLNSPEEVLIIPVLIGTSDEGEQTHLCEESQGQELNL